MSKQLLNTNGEKLGEITLNEAVFGVEPNLHVMHLALRRQLNNARQGSACAKTRAEVSGGGKKPWKQKGTGRARAGSLRSPLFAGGGVIFGPKPRSFEINMPQKARKLALKSAMISSGEPWATPTSCSHAQEISSAACSLNLEAGTPHCGHFSGGFSPS